MFTTIHALLLSTIALAAPLHPRRNTVSVTGSGLTFFSPNLTEGSPMQPPTAYTCYSGSAANFPPLTQWASFNDLWNFQVTNAFAASGDSSSDIQDLKSSILSTSRAAKVDPRVILGIILQESSGNLNVGCTNNGVENCGIMQSHDPSAQSFDEEDAMQSINEMVCTLCWILLPVVAVPRS